jgi:hypothetical protein
MLHTRQSLPTELWLLIVSGLSSPSDLAHLSATSSRLLHIVRPFLFRKVEVKAVRRRSNASGVLALLDRDKSLARCVVDLTLERCLLPGETQHRDIQSHPSLINVGALANLVSLKHVALYGPVFRNEHEQLEFGRVLSPGSGIALEELTYVAEDDYELFPGERFGDIGGLKKLYWNGSDECAFLPSLVVYRS